VEALKPAATPTVTIWVEGVPRRVAAGQNLLQACLSVGIDVPHFCWHPALHSVGACRQCAVKLFRDEADTHGKIVMACETAAAEGTRISVDDAEAAAFRAAVIAWLMAGHPHDCPVCDEGGACHLQDMTVMTGHVSRRYRFAKRTHRSQDLGPLVNHEMNRCIQCYRCVRFYRDLAGGRDLEVFGSRDQVYFGRRRDGALASGLAGNLVEICPTGVFTDKTFKRHFVRSWDLATAPSVCVHCGVGCNTIPGERDGMLRVVRNRYHGDVNGFFLCDRGRFGYEFVNSALRVRRPLVRPPAGGPPAPVTRGGALEHLRPHLYLGAPVIGIGSPRASLEANYALRRLVGPERFFSGASEREHRLAALAAGILRDGAVRVPSLREAAAADAVLLLGEDVAQTAPLLALALRQAAARRPLEEAVASGIPAWRSEPVARFVQGRRGPFFVATPLATGLDDLAAEIRRGAPAALARLAAAVAGRIDAAAPPVAGLPAEDLALAARIGDALLAAARPLIVAGAGPGADDVVRAAANVATALTRAGRQPALALALPECNGLGLALLEPRAPAEIPVELPGGRSQTIVVLENDLFRRAGQPRVTELLQRAACVVVIDHLFHATAAAAEVVLPAATYAEAGGTLVSAEGRAQRFYPVLPPADDVRESRRWLEELMAIAGQPLPWSSADGLRAALAAEFPALAAVATDPAAAGGHAPARKIPRQTHRASGRTVRPARDGVREPPLPPDPESPFAYSMEGDPGHPPPALINRYGAPGWNSVQAAIAYQDEPGGHLRGGDPGTRLLEPAAGAQGRYFTAVPAPFAPQDGGWYVVPMPHLFGSEELSARAPGIAELAPQPFLALNPAELVAHGLAAGEVVAIVVDGVRCRLPLRTEPSLPPGVAAAPAGVPGLPWLDLPAWAAWEKVPS
jgi:NADH-quinone oxidoreductase subunit G